MNRLGNDFGCIAIAPVLCQSSEAASYAASAVQGFIASLSLATLHRGPPSMIEAGQRYFAPSGISSKWNANRSNPGQASN
jgi:hypothetical protein